MSDRERTPPGAPLFYVTAGLSLLVSVNTSWRFFGDVLHITDAVERAALFSVLEMLLVACGWAMRARVRAEGRPGRAREVAWAACALSGYMAWVLSGPAAGTARVVLGPVLGLVSLHLALGIELRHRRAGRGALAQIGRELRERCLSRLSLANDERDAATRTRERAGRRAARLALTNHAPFARARLARALRASGVAHDVDARERMLGELAALRHAGDLATLSQPSPWVVADSRSGTTTAVPAPPVSSATTADGWESTGSQPESDQVPVTPVQPRPDDAGQEPVGGETTILRRVVESSAAAMPGHARPGAELQQPDDRPVEHNAATGDRPAPDRADRPQPDDPYKEAVTAAATDTEAVRIALTATGRDRPREVARWITDLGRPVTAEAVRSAIRRNRSQASREAPVVTLSEYPRPDAPRLATTARP